MNSQAMLESSHLELLEMYQRMFKQYMEVQCKFSTEIFYHIFQESLVDQSMGMGFRLRDLAQSRVISLINTIVSRADILSSAKTSSFGSITPFSDEIKQAYEDIFKGKKSEDFMKVVRKKRDHYQKELMAENSSFMRFMEFVPDNQSREDKIDSASQEVSESSLIVRRDKINFYNRNPVKLRMIESPSVKKDLQSCLGEFQYYCRSIDTTEKYANASNISDNFYRVFRKHKKDNLAAVSKVSDTKDYLGRGQEKIDQILDCLVLQDRNNLGEFLALLVLPKNSKDCVILRTNQIESFILGNAQKVWFSSTMNGNFSNTRLPTNNLIAKTDTHIFYLFEDKKGGNPIINIKAEPITEKSANKNQNDTRVIELNEVKQDSAELSNENILNYKIEANKNIDGSTSVALVFLLKTTSPGAYRLRTLFLDDFFQTQGDSSKLRRSAEIALQGQEIPSLLKVAIAQKEVMVLAGNTLYYWKKPEDGNELEAVKVANNCRTTDLWGALGRFVVRQTNLENGVEFFNSFLCYNQKSPVDKENQERIEFSQNSHKYAFENFDFRDSQSQAVSSDSSTMIIMIGRPKNSEEMRGVDKPAFAVFSLTIEPETLI